MGGRWECWMGTTVLSAATEWHDLPRVTTTDVVQIFQGPGSGGVAQMAKPFVF